MVPAIDALIKENRIMMAVGGFCRTGLAVHVRRQGTVMRYEILTGRNTC